MNIAVSEKYVGQIPTGGDFDQWIDNLLAYKVETWGLTDQDYTLIGEQFGMPGNSLWYLPEGNYRLMNAPVSVIGLEAASCDFVNIYVYLIHPEDSGDPDKMIIMEFNHKRYVKYKSDESNEWTDITNYGTDGVDVAQVHVGTEPPEDTDIFWVDTRGLYYDPDVEYDPVVVEGVVTFRYWNGTEWKEYVHEDVMLHDVYNPQGKTKDPFTSVNDAIEAFLAIYNEFVKHTENKLHLIHITDEDRESYNTTKVYRADLNVWVDIGGKLYNEMIEFITKMVDEHTHASELDNALEDIYADFEIHINASTLFAIDEKTEDVLADDDGIPIGLDYQFRPKIVLDNEGTELDLEDGILVTKEDYNHTHLTEEQAEAFDHKSDPDHTHDGSTAEVDFNHIMDRFVFDKIMKDLFEGQSDTPRAMAYGNDRLIILGYNSDDVFYSDDGGYTWNTVKNTAGAKTYDYLTYDEDQNAWFAVADSEFETIVSYDNGLTWQDTDPLIYTAPKYCNYGGKFVKIEDGVIYQSVDAFNWYPKSIVDISQGVFDEDSIPAAVVHSPKYPAVIMIVRGSDGENYLCIYDLRNSGITNMVPEVYDRTIQVQSLVMFNMAPTKKGQFYYGVDDVFTDIDGTEYARRRDFHNGNTIYYKPNVSDLEVYKIVDSTRLGTPSYRDGLMKMVDMSNLTDWASILDKPTTLAGYGIDPVKEGILTQREWEQAKTIADNLTAMDTIVYGWNGDEIGINDTVKYLVDPEAGIYLYNETQERAVLIQIGGETPYQQGALSVNDNIDIPTDAALTDLQKDMPVICQVSGYQISFAWKDVGIVVHTAEISEMLKSIKSVRSNLEDQVDSIKTAQHLAAKGMVDKGLALEFQIPVTNGKFIVTDVCFNGLDHVFMAVGLFTPDEGDVSYPAATVSTDALTWSEVVQISEEPSECVRCGSFRNVSYGWYVVATESAIWISADGSHWDTIQTTTIDYTPMRIVSQGDTSFIFRQGEPSYHVVYAIESTTRINPVKCAWNENKFIDACLHDGNLYALVEYATDSNEYRVFYEEDAGVTNTWSSVKITKNFDANRMYFDVNQDRLCITGFDAQYIQYCENVSNIEDWKLSIPRKKCHFDANFAGSKTQLCVNIGEKFEILPSSYFANKNAVGCPITMTGTIEDEIFATEKKDSQNQYSVAGCYGDGIFMVFAPVRLEKNPKMSVNYTLFYVNDNTVGRWKTAKFVLDTTPIIYN